MFIRVGRLYIYVYRDSIDMQYDKFEKNNGKAFITEYHSAYIF